MGTTENGGGELAVVTRMTEKRTESEFQIRGTTEKKPAIRFALAIPHTPWVPERVKSFQRLTEALGIAELQKFDADLDGVIEEVGDSTREEGLIVARAFTEKAKPHVWSENLMRWALASSRPPSGVTHLVQLQDDVIPAPNFFRAAQALVEAYPDELLGLETAHQAAPALVSDPDETVRIITTADGLIGVGWIIPVALIEEFLEWRATKLRPGGIEAITEDTLMGVWCLATGRRVFHPVPTLIDHDVSIVSTYGNDQHANRRPLVRWDNAKDFGDQWDARELEAPNFWRGGRKLVKNFAPDGHTFLGMRTAYSIDPEGARRSVRHMGRFYGVTPRLAMQWVEGFDEKAYRRAMADDGQRQLRRIAILRRARLDEESRERVLVCTPTRGGIAPHYAAGMTALVRLFEIDVDNGLELLDSWQWQEDVVRVRSRFLRKALETDCTSVHFRDADIATGGTVVLGMLQSGKDFVCAPYPARDGIPWDLIAKALAAGDTRSLEALAYQYKIGPTPKTGQFDDSGCSPVEWMPLGCSIIRRRAIEKILDFYDRIGSQELDLAQVRNLHGAGRHVLVERIEALCEELEQWRKGHRGLLYADQVDGGDFPTVGAFQLICRESSATKLRRLYGEDQSFCLRAGDAGVQPFMYLGVGSPVAHVGELVYRGSLESFGLSRAPKKATPKAPERGIDAESFALDEPEDPRSNPGEVPIG